MPDIVVGSGPSGASAAMGLLARGRSVVMVDVGEQLEPELEARRATLASLSPDEWDATLVRQYKAPQLLQQTEDIRRYGSDFLLRDPDSGPAPRPPWLGLRRSFALGGLSNGWGAAVLPYRNEDLAGWPIGVDDLAPHYRAVADFMPIAGRRDDLEALFPALDMSRSRPLAASAQAETLLLRIGRQREALAAIGVVGGAARQAAQGACVRCGLCLHGCPYEYVFKASQVVEQMRARPGFSYRPGLRVLAFEEAAGGVRVICRRSDGSQEVVAGDRLFLGAGVLSTAEIVLRSMAAETELELRDSQHLFLPMLHLWSAGADPARERRHALTQVFLELVDPTVSPFTVHAQLYTYNEFYALDMMRRYGARLPSAGPLFEILCRRLIVSQIFLHSEHSHRIGIRWTPEADELQLRLIENPETGQAAARARRAMAKAVGRLGLAALIPASRAGAPGSSFHVGGAMPMRRRPTGLESDRLGRINGLSRVHLVDASNFPTIPATTITYSVMANAHRIALEAAAL